MAHTHTTTAHCGGGRRYARRAALLLAATAAITLATSLGSAFADGYRSRA